MISADGQGDDAYSLEELSDRIGLAIARVVVALGVDLETSDHGVGLEVVRRFFSRLDVGLRHEFLRRMSSGDWVHEGRRIARAVVHGEPWPEASTASRRGDASRERACSQSTG